MRAPDFVEPARGWRVWDVVEQDDALRLRSPSFLTVWQPRRETVARCRRSLASRAWNRRPDHEAPDEHCTCGVYAARTAAGAAPYLSRLFARRNGVVHRVIGLVSLWGSVVECEVGWRASAAYPAVLYVPRPRRRLRSLFTALPGPALPAEEIALGLADYGVPVELVDCATSRELASVLDARPAGLLFRRRASAA